MSVGHFPDKLMSLKRFTTFIKLSPSITKVYFTALYKILFILYYIESCDLSLSCKYVRTISSLSFTVDVCFQNQVEILEMLENACMTEQTYEYASAPLRIFQHLYFTLFPLYYLKY